MKNSNEMVNSLFERRDKYFAEKKQKQKTRIKMVLSVCSVCLVVILGVGIWQLNLLKQSPISDNSDPKTQKNKGGKTDVILYNDDIIIWADEDINSAIEELTEWNNKAVTFRLLNALETSDEKNIFAILFRPTVDYTFEFKGKTLAEYYSAMCEEKNLSEMLSQLLKEGDALKYGKALYETGTPSGEKWAKELYEERIKFYGDEILGKYITEGQFLKDKLEQDIAASKNKTEATTAYKKAMNAYLEELAASMPGSFSPKVISETDCLVVYLTKDEFNSFDIDGGIFDLAFKDSEKFGVQE